MSDAEPDRANDPAAPRNEPLPGASFASHFPDDPELASLLAAFDRGDYARVRRDAPRLASRTPNDAVRAAALELRSRIDPDPTSRALLLVAIALFVVLAGYYLSHAAHGGAG